jgi:hypothetical protein
MVVSRKHPLKFFSEAGEGMPCSPQSLNESLTEPVRQ